MSFHAYVRKLLGFKRSNLNRYPLENISCKIKENCGNHKPWPLAFCDKCKPADVTLNRQVYANKTYDLKRQTIKNIIFVFRNTDMWIIFALKTNNSCKISWIIGAEVVSKELAFYLAITNNTRTFRWVSEL